MKQHKASNPNRIVRNTTKPHMTKEAYNLDQRVQQLWRHTTVMERELLLNAWYEVGDEMRRIVDAMSAEEREDLLPDWFDARLRELEGKHW